MKTTLTDIEALIIFNTGWHTEEEHELHKIAKAQIEKKGALIYLVKRKEILTDQIEILRNETKT